MNFVGVNIVFLLEVGLKLSKTMLAILILFVCVYFTDQKPIFEDVRV